MIYRIEFKRDGSIATCVAVESHLKDGGLVVYVEADSPERAIATAQSRFSKWREAKISQANAKGLCMGCWKRKREGKSPRCRCCKRRIAREIAERRALEVLPEEEREAARAKRTAAIRERRVERARLLGIRAVAIHQARSDAFWDAGGVPKSSSVHAALRQCLRAFDRAPELFRLWLLERIEGKKATAAE